MRSPGVAIVNQTFADRFFPKGGAIGRRLVRPGRNGKDVEIEIVGVAADSKVGTLGESAQPLIYRPDFSSRVLVRVEGNPAALVTSVNRALRDVDPSAAILTQTMRDYSAIATWPTRIGAQFLAALSGLGLVLALIGLYGVIAFVVARRTSEIGIRMALGASRAGILQMVLRDGARVIGIGVAIGVAAALMAMRPLALILPAGLNTRDPLTLVVATLVVAAAGLASVAIPARRASRIDPVVALRID
jgi:ABC-type antimicrobial peptide transport system permease subunit